MALMATSHPNKSEFSHRSVSMSLSLKQSDFSGQCVVIYHSYRSSGENGAGSTLETNRDSAEWPTGATCGQTFAQHLGYC